MRDVVRPTSMLTPRNRRAGRVRWPMRYEFRVDGVLSDEARSTFTGMRIVELPPQTLMDGEVIDESHLHGNLAQLAALGMTVVSVLPDPPSG